MKLFCTDGTTIECTTFRALDSGVLLFQDEEPEADAGHEEADGFVPITQLQYVLPDEVQPGQATGGLQQRPAAPGGQQGPGQASGPQQGQGGVGLEPRTGGRSGSQSGGQRSGRGSSRNRPGPR